MRHVGPRLRVARWLRVIGIVGAVGLAGELSGRLVAQPAQGTPLTGTGLILGQVVDGTDGRPIPGAAVSFSAGGAAATGAAGQLSSPGANRVLSDSQGRFVFGNLPAGSFVITATAAGYYWGAYGQLRPGGSSRPVVLLPDQQLGGVTVALWKVAAITGTVVDEGGAAVIGALVRAMHRAVSGQAVRFNLADEGRTDDRGMFRLSLFPGDYVVSLPSGTTTMPLTIVDAFQKSQAAGNVAADRSFSQQLSESNAPYPNSSGIRVGDANLQQVGRQGLFAFTSAGSVFVQPPLFFAGATTVSAASVLSLSAGEERSNVDFQLKAVAARTVSGTVTGPDGPAINLGVRLLPATANEFASDSGEDVAVTITRAQGDFTFLAVPPGSYILRVLRMARPAGFLAGTSPAQPTLFAQVPVAVGDRDVSGLSVSLRTGPRLRGRVVFDGVAEPPSGQGGKQIMIILLLAGSQSIPGGLAPSVAAADGQFMTVSVPPGKYLVAASAPGWILKSAVVNGRDVSESPLDLDANDVGGMVLTFFDRPSQLSGTVRDLKGNPDPNATVLLFPGDYWTWIQDGMTSQRFRSRRAGAAGEFTFNGLVPGEYRLIAINEGTLVDSPDRPDVIEAAGPLAAHITLGESARQTHDLTTVQLSIR